MEVVRRHEQFIVNSLTRRTNHGPETAARPGDMDSVAPTAEAIERLLLAIEKPPLEHPQPENLGVDLQSLRPLARNLMASTISRDRDALRLRRAGLSETQVIELLSDPDALRALLVSYYRGRWTDDSPEFEVRLSLVWRRRDHLGVEVADALHAALADPACRPRTVVRDLRRGREPYLGCLPSRGLSESVTTPWSGPAVLAPAGGDGPVPIMGTGPVLFPAAAAPAVPGPLVRTIGSRRSGADALPEAMRANGRREYCQLSQEFDNRAFETDHIRSRRHLGPAVTETHEFRPGPQCAGILVAPELSRVRLSSMIG